MDAIRFDRLSKALAGRGTRRGVLGVFGAAGLAAAVVDEAAAGGQVTCVYDFDGTIDVGPSSTVAQANTVAGELTIVVGQNGAIDSGSLLRADGSRWSVVGQATGRAISLRFSVPDTGAFVAEGAGRRAISGCTTAMGGPASGPLKHDAGSWTATLKPSGAKPGPTATAAATSAALVPTAQSSEPAAPPTSTPADTLTGAPSPTATKTPTATATATVQPTVQPTSACQLVCGDSTLGVDLETCTCLCAPGAIFCGDLERTISYVGYCSVLDSSYTDCGACGHGCTGNQTCTAGVCGCQLDCGAGNSANAQCECDCASGLTPCSAGYCADIVHDPKNCGACGIVCPPFEGVCNAGACVAQADAG